jgi:Tfp pilus assembly protein PilX
MRSMEVHCSKGFALPAALLVLLILAVISAAMILVVSSETRIHTSDAQNTQAYYGAEAAMEKMMVDLNELYQTQQSPNVAQIQALGNSSNWPSLSGITYSEYGTGGFTVACENAVYIQGNYNANNSGFGDPHAAAAVIADAVITLSNNWNDLNSFANPTSTAGRTATQTWHRLAIAAGKNRSFPIPLGTHQLMLARMAAPITSCATWRTGAT